MSVQNCILGVFEVARQQRVVFWIGHHAVISARNILERRARLELLAHDAEAYEDAPRAPRASFVSVLGTAVDLALALAEGVLVGLRGLRGEVNSPSEHVRAFREADVKSVAGDLLGVSGEPWKASQISGLALISLSSAPFFCSNRVFRVLFVIFNT